jgi:hypothetical protein
MEADIIIIGGGLAGLSLASELVKAQCSLSISIIDATQDFARPGTWLTWPAADGSDDALFQQGKNREWPAWSMSSESRIAAKTTDRPLVELNPLHMADYLAGSLHHKRNLHIHGNIQTTGIVWSGHRGWHIDTTSGEMRCTLLIDTRPPSQPTPYTLNSHELEVEISRSIFDTLTASLMDFDLPFENMEGARYITCLPKSRTSALITDTRFGIEDTQCPDDEVLHAWVERQGASITHIRKHKTYTLPLDLRRPQPSQQSGFARLALAANEMRPLPGFMFHAIRRKAADIAACIMSETPAQSLGDYAGLKPTVIDTILTRHMIHEPEKTQDLYLQLFEKSPAASFTNVCTSGGTIWDKAALLATMPREAIRSIKYSKQPKPSSRIPA